MHIQLLTRAQLIHWPGRYYWQISLITDSLVSNKKMQYRNGRDTHHIGRNKRIQAKLWISDSEYIKMD